MSDFFDDLDDPFESLNAAIDEQSESAVAKEIRALQLQDLDGPMSRCVSIGWMRGLRIFSDARIIPGEASIQVAIDSKDRTYLGCVLDAGWPIDQPMRGGSVPSVMASVNQYAPI